MAENSKIEWTHHTFNPWIGCTKVSDGCKNCYAETLMDTRYKKTKWGPRGLRVIKADSGWSEPVKWNRDAEAAGERRRVFCASLADVFEGPDTMPAEAWPDVVSARARLIDLIHRTPHLDWLLLTKRPQNVQRLWDEAATEWGEPGTLAMPLPNVWLGTSIEDQKTADERIPELLKCPAAVRFLSCEPLLGRVDLDCHPSTGCPTGWLDGSPGIDWVIAGGESGPGARPCNAQWIRSLVGQCKAASVPVFVKQLGANVTSANDVGFEGDTPTSWPMDTDTTDLEQGWQGQLVRVRLKNAKGNDPAEWPNDLRVREMPTHCGAAGFESASSARSAVPE